MDWTLVAILYFAFVAIGILWLLAPRGPSIEDIVAQHGSLHVFPELRLPRQLREKKPKELSIREGIIIDVAAFVLSMLLMVALMGGGQHHDRCDDDY